MISLFFFFFFNDTATTEIYTLSLHDALPIFVEEHAKLRAMSQLWEELGRERCGVEDPKHLRFRYGVQVNSLGLTEQQPENNVQRIVLEALAVTLGRNARARAIQLPAWNEALGLPRPWDQQRSEEHTSELQSRQYLVCRLLLEK